MSGDVASVSLIIPTYRNNGSIVDVARAILAQPIPSRFLLEVILVEDGYDSALESRFSGHLPADVRFVRLDRNAGRAIARNAGASIAAGDALLFLDDDCFPSDNEWLIRLVAALSAPGIAAAGGPVRGVGNGFWARYQADVRTRRTVRHSNAEPALTTANLAIRRELFERCHGFDERYRGYGFEDRDLLLRLAAEGELLLVPEAAVIHHDALRLADVAKKLQEAGATTSALFGRDHPAAYRALGYAAIDCKLHPWLQPAAVAAGPLAMAAAPLIDRWLDTLPYSIGKGLVKAISALAFLYGTSRRSSSA